MGPIWPEGGIVTNEMTLYSDRFLKALEYAAQTHQSQQRKGTQIPYIGHLLGVASIVIDAGGTEDEAIAALLHDAPEDRGGQARLRDIRDRFGERVATIIDGCSDPLDEAGKADRPWDVRKAAYLEHLRTCADKSVYLVSAADKLHNARATLADVRADGASVWERFNAGRQATLENYKALIALYRQGPSDVRRDRVVDELARVIELLCEATPPPERPRMRVQRLPGPDCL